MIHNFNTVALALGYLCMFSITIAAFWVLAVEWTRSRVDRDLKDRILRTVEPAEPIDYLAEIRRPRPDERQRVPEGPWS